MNRVPPNRFVTFFLIATSGLAWDLYSKSAVFASLGYEGQSTQWVQSFCGGWIKFRLFTSFNRGALFGLGQGYTWLFAMLSVAAFFAILYWLFVAGAAKSLWLTVSLALITSGTLGNLYDRLGFPQCLDPRTQEPIYAVRDFLLFTFGGWPWPVFNFADVCLVTGACMLVLQSAFGHARTSTAPSQPSGTSGTAGARSERVEVSDAFEATTASPDRH